MTAFITCWSGKKIVLSTIIIALFLSRIFYLKYRSIYWAIHDDAILFISCHNTSSLLCRLGFLIIIMKWRAIHLYDDFFYSFIHPFASLLFLLFFFVSFEWCDRRYNRPTDTHPRMCDGRVTNEIHVYALEMALCNVFDSQNGFEKRKTEKKKPIQCFALSCIIKTNTWMDWPKKAANFYEEQRIK